MRHPAMNAGRRRLLAVLATAPLGTQWPAASAWAQGDFPGSTPIKVICPYAAGGPVDVAGRYVTERLQAVLGTALIENIPGAGGSTGTAAVLRAPADGHTLLMQFSQALVTTQFLYKSARYDALRDFIPIWSIGTSGTVFVVNANSPYRTLQEFVAAARAEPGKLSFGSAGVGSTPHINAEMFMRETGIRLAHVPYRSSGQVVTDILGGHVDSQFSSISSVAGLIAQGKLRGLAVLRTERIPELPQVPTLAEGGVPGWEPPRSTFALFAPAGTPPAVVERLTSSLRKSFAADKDGQARLAKIGLGGEVAGADLVRLVHREYELFKKVIEDAGIQPIG